MRTPSSLQMLWASGLLALPENTSRLRWSCMRSLGRRRRACGRWWSEKVDVMPGFFLQNPRTGMCGLLQRDLHIGRGGRIRTYECQDQNLVPWASWRRPCIKPSSRPVRRAEGSALHPPPPTPADCPATAPGPALQQRAWRIRRNSHFPTRSIAVCRPWKAPGTLPRRQVRGAAEPARTHCRAENRKRSQLFFAGAASRVNSCDRNNTGVGT